MVALTSEGHVTEIVAMRGHSLELDQGGWRNEPTVLVEARVIVGGGQFLDLGGARRFGELLLAVEVNWIFGGHFDVLMDFKLCTTFTKLSESIWQYHSSTL